jgi:lipopolysaccharide export system protein LptA
MKSWKSKKTALALALAVFCSSSLLALAAPGEKTEVTADTFDYDSATGMVVAQGGVKVVRGQQTMTGQTVEYNSKTQDAHVSGSGGVQVTGPDLNMTSVELWSVGGKQLIAQGNVVAVKGDKRLIGPRVEYFQESEIAITPQGGTIFMPDGNMTADHIQAFLKEDRAIGTGNVHIVSEVRKLDATSNLATYYGEKSGQDRSKIIMTGNARAVQDGNVLVGNTICT